jgi:hypothetical protein
MYSIRTSIVILILHLPPSPWRSATQLPRRRVLAAPLPHPWLPCLRGRGTMLFPHLPPSPWRSATQLPWRRVLAAPLPHPWLPCLRGRGTTLFPHLPPPPWRDASSPPHRWATWGRRAASMVRATESPPPALDNRNRPCPQNFSGEFFIGEWRRRCSSGWTACPPSRCIPGPTWIRQSMCN